MNKKPYDRMKDLFQCRTQHCVCRDGISHTISVQIYGFQCRTQHCVCRDNESLLDLAFYSLFQCRTQHCVCRDREYTHSMEDEIRFQYRTQHCVCRDFTTKSIKSAVSSFNAARSIVCVETPIGVYAFGAFGFQCRTQHCMCRDARLALNTSDDMSFNAARSIVCVETLCPAALVPRGLRRHFGKTRFFAPFLASADELCPEKRGIHRRCPLCGAGCTVLERRNGGMWLCARAGALPFSSLL